MLTVKRRSSYVTTQVDSTRATINMVHDNVSLTVSQDEAAKVEDEAKRRLLASKKLSLVVDLDQTIVHATVDPTVAEWQKDEKNPNHGAVRDVRAFQLVDDGQSIRGCWYYIKLRPGLQEFLENISKLYELHIYTMGTRAYAQNIATLIDPGRKIFGERILSRDESGSLVAKNLQRLFPVDTKMVVIIDDRGDVWNWNENLIKVTPYDFFVGIGDINSSFLPKKPGANLSFNAEPVASSDPQPGSPGKGVGGEERDVELHGDASKQVGGSLALPAVSTTSGVSALEQLVSMGGGDDPLTLQAQTSRQLETVAAQLQERPLLQKQKQLEAEDAAAEASVQSGENESSSGSSDAPSDSDPTRHKLLQDRDQELIHLEQALRKVHTAYFDTYAPHRANVQGGRVAELRGSQKRKQAPSDHLDLAMVPDVKTIMLQMKSRVLDGVVIVFSGVIPLHLDWNTNDLTLWARSFGAKVEKDVSRRTTHVVAARNRTAKVRQAVKRGKGRIKIVSPGWLTDSIIRWRRLDERSYLLNVEESEAASPKGGMGDDDELLSVSEELGSGAESDDDVSRANDHGLFGTRIRPPLSLTINEADDESDIEGLLPADLEDDHSPVGGTNEDWSKMHDEMNEFLGSDAEDSDGDSEASLESSISIRGKKRSRDESGDESSGENATKPIGRKKQAVSRGTSLSHTLLPGSTASAEGDSGLPTPDITAGEEGDGDWKDDDDDDDDNDADEDGDANAIEPDVIPATNVEGDGWSDFEDDLEAEMEKAATEEQGEG